MRTEECVCGGPPIASETLKGAGIHVAVHNADPVHTAWRRVRQAQESYAYEVRRLTDEGAPDPITLRDPRRQRPTAGTTTRDVSESTTGSSASGVEGAA